MEIVAPALKVVQYPHPSLRHKAVPITSIDDEVRRLAEAMLDLMYEHKGLGLAAPQVAWPFQMFVCNLAGDRDLKDFEYVFLNPVIVERQGTMEGEEGCLSFPGMYRKVRRARTVRAQAYNLKGELVEMTVSDLSARIWQHESDHLDGTLFIDKLGPIGQLASRGELHAFEQDYLKAQRRGEIAPNADLERLLSEREKNA